MAYEKDGVWFLEGNETDEEIEQLNKGNEEAFEKARPAREELVDKVLAEIELEEDDPTIH